MKTRIIRVDSKKPRKRIIYNAVKTIKNGELVAFPTETVYGLGANAFDARAVRKIFKAKGRPADNPLIVHVSDERMLKLVVEEIPVKAVPLMKKFWPGPLTIVFRKKKQIPNVVTAGGNTVAVRVPSHPVALALIKKAGVPIAAPSANMSTRPSPTEARHVYEDFNGKIPLILDGGKTDIGVESTVLDLTTKVPILLRKGKITKRDIEKVIGVIKIYTKKTKGVVKSPGQKYKHYAPKASLILVRGGVKIVKKIISKYNKKNIFIITFSENKNKYPGVRETYILGKKWNTVVAAKKFFSLLRECDKNGADIIIVEAIIEKGVGEALMDRISRAASMIV
jgi:L-threonylcarbamoyladenylate synthase